MLQLELLNSAIAIFPQLQVRNLAAIFGIFLAMESSKFMKGKSEVKNIVLLSL
jgi:hypothetical protein